MSPQDLVVTLLGLYVRTDQPVWSGGMVALLGEFGFSDGAARVALHRLVRRGFLERSRSGRLVFYALTDRARHVLEEGDRRIFSLGHPRAPGDGWTIVWHQLPESRRLEHSRLARRLRFLGFGPIQDGVWVSPHDHVSEVAALLRELGVSECASVFIAAPGSEVTALVGRAWDLSGLAERYEAFCAEFGPSARRRMGDFEAFMTRTRAVHAWRGFPALDPELPEELAPIGRVRSDALAVFEALHDGLREPAQRYFDVVAGTPVPA